MNQKLFLQLTVSIACLVPISAGFYGVLAGAAMLGGGSVDMDSHYRYLSGLLLGIGLGFLSTIRHIETHTERFQLLTSIVFLGGLARLMGFIHGGTDLPNHSMQFGLIMECVITPLLCLWQRHVARKFS